jgi:diaminopimelate decarboxylase
MASSYNSRPPAPEVLVKGTEYAVVRPRPDIDDLLGQDLMPDWLAAPGETRSRGAA